MKQGLEAHEVIKPLKIIPLIITTTGMCNGLACWYEVSGLNGAWLENMWTVSIH